MSSIICNRPFQIELNFCIAYNQIRKIRKNPILPNAVDKMGPVCKQFKYMNNGLINSPASGYIEINTLKRNDQLNWVPHKVM